MNEIEERVVKVEINLGELFLLRVDSAEIDFNPEAEEALERLIELQQTVNSTVEEVKGEIARKMLKFNPHFTALKGERIKINYSASGAKYKPEGEVKRHDLRFWTKKESWSLDAKAIDEYYAKNNRLPKGVAKNARSKTLRITRIDNAK